MIILNLTKLISFTFANQLQRMFFWRHAQRKVPFPMPLHNCWPPAGVFYCIPAIAWPLSYNPSLFLIIFKHLSISFSVFLFFSVPQWLLFLVHLYQPRYHFVFHRSLQWDRVADFLLRLYIDWENVSGNDSVYIYRKTNTCKYWTCEGNMTCVGDLDEGNFVFVEYIFPVRCKQMRTEQVSFVMQVMTRIALYLMKDAMWHQRFRRLFGGDELSIW